MRRLRRWKDAERGAVSVIMAVVMVVLLGFTALVVDVGLLYAERAQLQNGADAAALGVAQSCASLNPGPNCSASSPLAASLADSNALDGRTKVSPTSIDTAKQRVTVTTGAQDGSGKNGVSLFFARALGIPTAEVGAVAIARWGTPIGGPTVFPAIFSLCQVRDDVNGPLQLLVNHGNNANKDCNYGPSGAAVPGGFGWLAQPNGACNGTVTGEYALGRQGNDPPKFCGAVYTHWIAELTAGRKPTVLLPVFKGVSASGSNDIYHIDTFAAFEVTGWRFSGSGDESFRNTSTHAGSAECTGNCRGIIGKFITYVSLADGYTMGPVKDYGARIIGMTD